LADVWEALIEAVNRFTASVSSQMDFSSFLISRFKASNSPGLGTANGRVNFHRQDFRAMME